MDRDILPPLSIVLALLLLCAPALAAQKVAVITDGAIIPPAAHGLAKLEQSLRAKGYELADPAGADYLILAGVRSPNGEITKALNGLKAPLPDGPEALTIHRANYRGKPAVFLCGADAQGLMYAALDTAERISWTTGTGSPFQNLRDVSEKPYLTERGVSIYTMQRAYFESRLYDEQYWRRYFDLLAASRINTFIVIFGYENGGFMAPLYPYFFDVDGFPGVQLVGITREQQARNTAAFKAMMKLAHERGIDVTAGIWDHIYRGGVQGGGIPGASETAGKRVPGLVLGRNGVRTLALTPRRRCDASLRSSPRSTPSSSACTTNPALSLLRWPASGTKYLL